MAMFEYHKVTGITYEHYANGSVKKIIFDAKKFGDVIAPILQDAGALIETDFDKRVKEAYTAEEAKKETKKMIRTWWKK